MSESNAHAPAPERTERGARWRGRWQRRWREPVGWRRQLPLLVGLMVLWILLWDDLSWGNVVNGALLAVVVTRLFYLPPAELAGRVNLYWTLVFIGHFGWDLVRSSLHVAGLALRPGYVPENAVIAVSLHTSSDLLLTATGHALTLIPGSLIVDVDRLNTTLYVHVIDAPDDESIERNRRAILRTEERLIRAIGSYGECAALDAERRDGRRTPGTGG
jgi:multicomponent Na+:H+ antiporter subunit E